ncbi:MAG: CocE/NonD family hydrolase [Thermomicrobiales bacterium]
MARLEASPATGARPRAKTSAGAATPHRARNRRIRRIVVIAVSVVLVLAVVATGAISWIGAERAIHQPAKTWQWQLADFPALHAERVTIPSSTGITLAGTFFPGTSRTTIVLSHGFGNDQVEVLPWADFLVRAGYSTFVYDMRARGASGGDAITIGLLEQDDLVSVVDYLVTRPDVDPERIGALGVSLGGVTSILAAGNDPRIKAVAYCPFSDTASLVGSAFEANIGLPSFLFARRHGASANGLGLKISAVRTTDAASMIAPRPLLLIHGEDTRMCPGWAESTYLRGGVAQPKNRTGAGRDGTAGRSGRSTRRRSSAACSTSVELARRRGAGGKGCMGNARWRRIVDDRDHGAWQFLGLGFVVVAGAAGGLAPRSGPP